MLRSSDPVGPLAESLGQYRFDPLGYVMFAFPWGKPGTSGTVSH